MEINLINAIQDGYLKDKYSKDASEEYLIEGVPYVNFEFEVTNVDPTHKYLSWALIDHDSNPVCSFSWIHWLVANYSTENSTVVENLSESGLEYVGGQNSFASPLAKIQDEKVIFNYGGPMPPNEDHNYSLVVFAHATELNLEKGFFYNELLNELKKQTSIVGCECSILGKC